jgi:RNA polymerase sigma-70 factor (ECF subfamily)
MSQAPEHFDLVINIKKGDARSLELLFQSTYPALCAYAKKFLNDADESEEIVQELFYSLWKHRDRLDENQSLHGYLFTSVKNRCLNFLDAQKSKARYATLMKFLYVQESTDSVNSYHVLIEKELEKDFHQALQALPNECRKIFELSRFEGLKYQEIATRLDISIKTVETQISRALSKLRVQLKDYTTI